MKTRGPKGLQLEVRARRASRLLVINIFTVYSSLCSYVRYCKIIKIYKAYQHFTLSINSLIGAKSIHKSFYFFPHIYVYHLSIIFELYSWPVWTINSLCIIKSNVSLLVILIILYLLFLSMSYFSFPLFFWEYLIYVGIEVKYLSYKGQESRHIVRLHFPMRESSDILKCIKKRYQYWFKSNLYYAIFYASH